MQNEETLTGKRIQNFPVISSPCTGFVPFPLTRKSYFFKEPVFILWCRPPSSKFTLFEPTMIQRLSFGKIFYPFSTLFCILKIVQRVVVVAAFYFS